MMPMKTLAAATLLLLIAGGCQRTAQSAPDQPVETSDSPLYEVGPAAPAPAAAPAGDAAAPVAKAPPVPAAEAANLPASAESLPPAG